MKKFYFLFFLTPFLMAFGCDEQANTPRGAIVRFAQLLRENNYEGWRTAVGVPHAGSPLSPRWPQFLQWRRTLRGLDLRVEAGPTWPVPLQATPLWYCTGPYNQYPCHRGAHRLYGLVVEARPQGSTTAFHPWARVEVMCEIDVYVAYTFDSPNWDWLTHQAPARPGNTRCGVNWIELL